MKRKYTKKSRKHFRKKSRKHFRKNKMKKTTKKFRKMKARGFPQVFSSARLFPQVFSSARLFPRRAQVANVRQYYTYKTTQPNVQLYSYRKIDDKNCLLKQSDGSTQETLVPGIKDEDGKLKFIDNNGMKVHKTEKTMAKTGKIGEDFHFRTYQNKNNLDTGDTLIEIRMPGGRYLAENFIPIDVIEYVRSNYD